MYHNLEYHMNDRAGLSVAQGQAFISRCGYITFYSIKIISIDASYVLWCNILNHVFE